MKRKGLLIVELLIALLILSITAGACALRADIWAVTAKREAEKVFAKLSSLMNKADKTQTSFHLEVMPDKLKVQWSLGYRVIDNIPASKGCSYSWNAPNDKLYYFPWTNKYSQGATIRINGKNDTCYIKIATIGSRIRITDTD